MEIKLFKLAQVGLHAQFHRRRAARHDIERAHRAPPANAV